MKNYLVKPGSRLIIEILLSLVSLLQSVLISLEQNCLKVFISIKFYCGVRINELASFLSSTLTMKKKLFANLKFLTISSKEKFSVR